MSTVGAMLLIYKTISFFFIVCDRHKYDSRYGGFQLYTPQVGA
jgi:hypothetical protein